MTSAVFCINLYVILCNEDRNVILNANRKYRISGINSFLSWLWNILVKDTRRYYSSTTQHFPTVKLEIYIFLRFGSDIFVRNEFPGKSGRDIHLRRGRDRKTKDAREGDLYNTKLNMLQEVTSYTDNKNIPEFKDMVQSVHLFVVFIEKLTIIAARNTDRSTRKMLGISFHLKKGI